MRLEAKQLSCTKGWRVLFRNLSFAVEAGQFLLIQGDNGAGKSTLLRILAGLVTPDKGQVNLNGEGNSLISYQAHQDPLHCSLTVRQNLKLLLSLAGVKADPTPHLRALGMLSYEDTPCEHLSQGQRRKIALVALVTKASPMWLLDEPLTALDAQSMDWLSQQMEAHVAKGGILITASHLPIKSPMPTTVVNLSS